MRELAYQAHGPGSRFAGGQVGRAQDWALAEGWLTPHPSRPGFLLITSAGKRRAGLG